MPEKEKRRLQDGDAAEIFVDRFPVRTGAVIVLRVRIVIFRFDRVEKTEVEIVVNENGRQVSVISFPVGSDDVFPGMPAPFHIRSAPHAHDDDERDAKTGKELQDSFQSSAAFVSTIYDFF